MSGGDTQPDSAGTRAALEALAARFTAASKRVLGADVDFGSTYRCDEPNGSMTMMYTCGEVSQMHKSGLLATEQSLIFFCLSLLSISRVSVDLVRKQSQQSHNFRKFTSQFSPLICI